MSAEVFNFDNAFLAVSLILDKFRTLLAYMGSVPTLLFCNDSTKSESFCANHLFIECVPHHLQPG